MFLLDTCALSNLRKPIGFEGLKEFYRGHEAEAFFISSLSLGEIWKGIWLAKDERRQSVLANWARQIESYYGQRILPMSIEGIKGWAKISAERQRSGKPLPALDGLIAATALAHKLTLVTQNVRDFEGLGLDIIDP